MMVSDASVPDELVDGAKEVLSSNGTLVDPGPYVGAARGQHLSPTSEAALTKIGPKVKVKLIVTLEIARGKLLVTFRDGSSGSSLNETKLPARGKHPKLASRLSKKLNGATKRALAKLGGHAVAEPEERDDDIDEPEPTAAARPTPPSRPAPPAQASRPTPPPAAAQNSAPWNEGGEGQPGEEPEGEERPAEAAADSGGETDPADRFHVRLILGGGAGAREVNAPSKGGPIDVDTGFAFPALELGLGAQVVFGGQWILSGEVIYRTAFGLHSLKQQADLSVTSVGMSSHSVVLGLAPGYRFGPKDSVDLRLFLGYALRSLSSADAMVPGANINGLVIRPELRIPIASGLLTLRIAPELIVVLGSDTVLAGSVAGLASVGVGIGGEFSLDVRLAPFISLGVEYRESRAYVSSAWGTNLLDLERYALGRITVTL